MATNKKKIEKRWIITSWEFDPNSREVILTSRARTKPMTERKARNLAKAELLGQNVCWKIERAWP